MTGPSASETPGHRGPRAERAGRARARSGIDLPDHRQRPGLGRRGARRPSRPVRRSPSRRSARARTAPSRRRRSTMPATMTHLRPEPVAERAGGEHQAREHERVRVDDPLQRDDAGAEVVLDAAQRDADDRRVEEGQEQDREDGGERRAACPTAEPASAIHGVSVAARSRVGSSHASGASCSSFSRPQNVCAATCHVPSGPHRVTRRLAQQRAAAGGDRERHGGDVRRDERAPSRPWRSDLSA